MTPLRSAIVAYLQANAPGRANAVPRRRLLDWLNANGWDVADRGLRRAYANMPEVGSCGAGIFLILTADDRRAATRQLHSASMASLVREKRVRDAAPRGQLELWEEGA